MTVFDGDGDTYDDARAIAVGPSGIIGVTGCSEVDTNDRDVRVLALNLTGDILWSDRYSGPRLRGDDCGEAVAVDVDGSVAVAGSIRSVSDGDDLVALRYSASGERQWVATYDGPASDTDVGTGVGFTPNGDVVAAGYSIDSDQDYVAIRFSSEEEEPGCHLGGGTSPFALLLALLVPSLLRRRIQ